IYHSNKIQFNFGKARCLDPVICQKAFDNNTPLYSGVKYLSRAMNRPITASVLLISGCQDNQLSGDGSGNGTFTTALLKALNAPGKQHSYKTLFNQIKSLMPPTQVPNYYFIGATNEAFENSIAFNPGHSR